MFNFSVWIRKFHYQLGELEYCIFVRVSYVNWTNMASIHKSDKSFDLIVNETERPCLRTISIHCQIFPVESLYYKVRNNSAIIFKHTWTVSVENTSNPDVNIVLAMVFEHQ